MDRIVRAARNKVFKLRNLSLLEKLEKRHKSIENAYITVFRCYFNFMLYIYNRYYNSNDNNKKVLLTRKLTDVDDEFKHFHMNYPYIKLLMSQLTMFCRYPEVRYPERQVQPQVNMCLYMCLSEESNPFVPKFVLHAVCDYSKYFPRDETIQNMGPVKFNNKFKPDCEYERVSELIEENRRLMSTDLDEEKHRDILRDLKSIEKKINKKIHLIQTFTDIKVDIETRLVAYENKKFTRGRQKVSETTY